MERCDDIDLDGWWELQRAAHMYVFGDDMAYWDDEKTYLYYGEFGFSSDPKFIAVTRIVDSLSEMEMNNESPLLRKSCKGKNYVNICEFMMWCVKMGYCHPFPGLLTRLINSGIRMPENFSLHVQRLNIIHYIDHLDPLTHDYLQILQQANALLIEIKAKLQAIEADGTAQKKTESPRERKERLLLWADEDAKQNGVRGLMTRVAKREGITRQAFSKIMDKDPEIKLKLNKIRRQ
ncbi:MAG: hypothetical protein HQM04_17850 [Magnetococcales bacterium]|nr:hypothetical protein [Magnetococcales bacterium]MBF0116893.1 hypothetical protein [Magnetococcales bacterium]